MAVSLSFASVCRFYRIFCRLVAKWQAINRQPWDELVMVQRKGVPYRGHASAGFWRSVAGIVAALRIVALAQTCLNAGCALTIGADTAWWL